MNATDQFNLGLAAAVREHRAGRLHAAITAYEALRRRSPDNADVLQLLGTALAQLGRCGEAVVFLTRSAELAPDRLSVLLNLAQALHTLGREEDTLRACDRALALDGSLVGAYRTRTAALITLGRCEEALASAGHAVRLAPRDAGAHVDLGMALDAAGEPRRALDCFERAAALAPNLASAHHNRAVLLAGFHEHDRALESFDAALALQPHSAALHTRRATTLKGLGRLEEAVQGFSRALALEPGAPAALRNRAVAHYLLGRYAEALRDYEALAAQDQESAGDRLGRGTTLVALHRYVEALEPLEHAIEELPGEADAHTQRGVALLNLHRNADAVLSFDRALAIRPDVPEVLNNRGIALTETGRLSEALESLMHCAALNGKAADIHTNLGIVLKLLGRYREAAASFGRALSLRPDDPSTKFSLAFLHLTLGHFDQGWPLYEARFGVPALGNPPRRFAAPCWGGDVPLAGKTLLVHAEQGLGDVIHFCRYLPQLAAQGARVVFEVMPSLVALMQTLAGDIRIIARGEPVPPVDYFCPLLSLPLALGTRLATIPAQIPYLAAQPERVASWRERLEALPGLRVGIAWQGNPAVEQSLIWARGRSLPLAVLEPLARQAGVTLVSLQKGAGAQQLRSSAFAECIVDLGAQLDPGADAFVDTAAVMSSLDLVISSDTAIAHLAGALGRPVWTALPLSAEWRWLLDRSDSPWYPTMRLFRQTAAGDWNGVVNEIVSALQALAAA